MEAGNATDSPDKIAALHSALAGEASAAGATPETPTDTPVDAAQAHGGFSPAPDGTADLAGAEEVFQNCCETAAEVTYDEFYDSLKDVCGHDQADRIARRAALPQGLQKIIARSAARVAHKHGAAQFVNDEALLIGALALYGIQLAFVSGKRTRLLEKHAPAQESPAKPSPGAQATPTPPKTAKPAQAKADPNEQDPAQLAAAADTLKKLSQG